MHVIFRLSVFCLPPAIFRPLCLLRASCHLHATQSSGFLLPSSGLRVFCLPPTIFRPLHLLPASNFLSSLDLFVFCFPPSILKLSVCCLLAIFRPLCRLPSSLLPFSGFPSSFCFLPSSGLLSSAFLLAAVFRLSAGCLFCLLQAFRLLPASCHLQAFLSSAFLLQFSDHSIMCVLSAIFRLSVCYLPPAIFWLSYAFRLLPSSGFPSAIHLLPSRPLCLLRSSCHLQAFRLLPATFRPLFNLSSSCHVHDFRLLPASAILRPLYYLPASFHL